ncbi:MAG: hypothetical protein KDN05_03030 [Verrucomicrobiae bacterium]|nr:hypothetical protein [Verrucomicrobiae bacterium]MCP5545505.1 hypothetical protein [Akkermansiaceae bacterium]MCP5548221.1 hypothetical protein [Akkermansiaceae bacterium]
MDPLLLRFLHVGGVIALFASLGAILMGGSAKKSASILHGISLLIVLLVGFAILKKPPMGEPWWMIKLGIWFFIGAAPALAKRKVMAPPLVLALCILAGLAAAWLGIHRGF